MYTNCPTKHALTSTLVTNNNLMTTQNISQPNASPPASCAKKAGGGRKSQFANRQPRFIQHSPKPQDYATPRLRTRFGERAFSYTGPAAWNQLPSTVRQARTQQHFKRLLKGMFTGFIRTKA